MKSITNPIGVGLLALVLTITGRAWASPTEKVAYLGVRVIRADDTVREQLKLRRGVGLAVLEVEASGPAEKAGLKKHDVLEEADGQWLFNGEQFADLVRLHRAGDKVTLKVLREGQSQTIDATLDEKEISKDAEVAPAGTGWAYQLLLDQAGHPAPSTAWVWPGPEAGAAWKPGPFLGVEARPVVESLAAQLGLAEGTGVLVGEVVPDTPAQKAGLKANDIIVKLDKQTVNGPADFVNRIQSHARGDRVTLEVLRGGKSRQIEATLSEREKPDPARFRNMLRGYQYGPKIEMVEPPARRHGSVHILTDATNADQKLILSTAPLPMDTGPATTRVMVMKFDQGEITVNEHAGERYAVVKDPHARLLYQGPINTPAERAKIPKAIRLRLEQTEAQLPHPTGAVDQVETIRLLRPEHSPGFI